MAMIGNFHLSNQVMNRWDEYLLRHGLVSILIVLPVRPKCVTPKSKRKQKKAVESRKWLARANSSAIEILLIYC